MTTNRNYGELREIKVKLKNGEITASCWRQAATMCVLPGDNIELWDGNISRFMGKPIININVAADMKVCNITI